jgi:hypothetical protein
MAVAAAVPAEARLMPKRKPYQERTDLEKIQSQWHKLTGLHTREEWSAAVVRAATAAELAANFAIRQEFGKQAKVSKTFVDHLLLWANGLRGKLDHLLLPITKGRGRFNDLKTLQKLAVKLNSVRNGIAHQGHFCDEDEAKKIIEDARRFVHGIVQHYDPEFVLVDQRSKK